MVFFVHVVLKMQFNDINNGGKKIQNGIVQMHFFFNSCIWHGRIKDFSIVLYLSWSV